MDTTSETQQTTATTPEVTTGNGPATPPTQEQPSQQASAQESPAEAPNGFLTFNLSDRVMRAIVELGYTTPTPIQEQAIALLLGGRDVIAQAPTGTGKTAAYGLPIVEQLDEENLRPQALIIAPTRELAIQVAEALHGLGKYREMVTLPIYGGQPYDRQLRALARGVQVVVGTPGRLLDHMRRKTLDLSQVRTVVLDEADEMLSMGFIEDIEAILAELPSAHQTALFSATIPPRIARLAEQYLHNPELVRVSTREAIAPRVRQVYYEVVGPAKMEALSRILDLEQPDSAIVFVRTRHDADVVSEQLNGQGYLAQAIHGEINQAQRERVLDRFRKGHTQLLVATDVAARGLDIPDVSHIINYDLPLDAESYVHRIGRTGRAGRGGEALTLVTPRERRQLRLIEDAIHRHLERLRLPTLADVAARRRAAFREEVLEILDGGQLDAFLALVEDLVGTHNPTELAAAAFKMAAQARDAQRPGRTESWIQQPVGGAAPGAGEPGSMHGMPGMPSGPGMSEQAPFGADDGRGMRGRRVGPPSDERVGASGPPRGRRDRPQVETGMVRLFLRVGRRDGVRPADLVGAIANEAHVSSDVIGDIDLYDTFSFVEVAEDTADAVREALNRTTIRGRAVRATLARPGDEWQVGEEDGRPVRSDAVRESGRDGMRDGGRDAARGGPRPWARDRDGGSFGGPRDAYPPRERDGDDERRPLRIPYASRRTPPPGRKSFGRPSSGGRPFRGDARDRN